MIISSVSAIAALIGIVILLTIVSILMRALWEFIGFFNKKTVEDFHRKLEEGDQELTEEIAEANKKFEAGGNEVE